MEENEKKKIDDMTKLVATIKSPGWKVVSSYFDKVYLDSLQESINGKDKDIREYNRIKVIVIKEVYEEIAKDLKWGEHLLTEDLKNMTKEVKSYE